MPHKTRPYLFYDVAISICSTCYRKVEAKTVFQDGNVYLLKRCPQHGPERVLIADDVDYYRRSREVFIKPPEMPLVYNTPVKWGCRYHIATNLVVTLKKGLNDHEIGKTIDFALQQPCVRGVTFQPIQDAGRLETWVPTPAGTDAFVRRAKRSEASEDDPEARDVDLPNPTSEGGAPLLPDFGRSGNVPNPGHYVRNFNPATDRLTLTEVRRKILEQTKVFRPEDLIPVPCHPDSLAMAYALKLNGKVTPLTSMIPPEVLINGAANTILYEQEPLVRDNLFKLFATNHSPQSSAGTLRELLCCLPQVWIPDASEENCHPERSMISGEAGNHAQSRDPGSRSPLLSYENIFRIIIMQFIDAHSFDVRSVKKTCVHIVHPDGRLIPFDTYNLFYRDGLEQTRLDPLRKNAEAALAAV